MFLFIARHAWAGSYGDTGDWRDDSERPLTAAGMDRYREVLARLQQAGMQPEWIATSPYRRCRQTAQLISEVCGGVVSELEELALGAELDPLIEWTNARYCQQVCWVGHNPDVGHLAAHLLGEGDCQLRFAKGSVAALRFAGEVELADGELYWHATAKLLGV